MSKLSVYAGLEIVVEAGAMIPFQLEPRSAVHVFGQDETNLLHSKGIFSTPADLPRGRGSVQLQNISPACR